MDTKPLSLSPAHWAVVVGHTQSQTSSVYWLGECLHTTITNSLNNSLPSNAKKSIQPNPTPEPLFGYIFLYTNLIPNCKIKNRAKEKDG
ncbi:unnamed protein product [Prunus brigantina]